MGASQSLQVSDNIRLARQTAGLSRAELAESAGIDPADVAAFESGSRFPSPQDLAVISEYVDESVPSLLTTDTQSSAESAEAAGWGPEPL